LQASYFSRSGLVPRGDEALLQFNDGIFWALPPGNGKYAQEKASFGRCRAENAANP